MNKPTTTLVITTLASVLSFNAFAAEPPLTQQDLPRLKPTEPANVMKTFTVRPGFHLELAAHEPQVVSPVALSFDENGRMYVVEMIDYSERRAEKLSRIRLLEDKDGDGVYEKSTVYAEGLAWATGVICFGGGVFVVASPDLIWFKDTNGDGKADQQKVIFTGFAEGREKLNMQALPNSLNWGLDNRIHVATGPNGGILRNLVRPNDAPLDVNRRDICFNPTTFELFAENGGGQNGMSFDSQGRKYTTSNSRHLMAYMFDSKYAARNPLYTLPSPIVDIPVDGPAAEVYRTSPDEAWRVIRTKWRVDGTVKGVVEGGGRASGYFTGATGGTIYRGNAYPSEFQENAFIGDAGSNLVHRKRIRPDGVGVLAERAADEQTSEFVASSDNWFRPVQFANAPDGCLYIIDMYREVIEHPWSIPESIKQFIDLNSGNDRGRIYRAAPNGFKQPAQPALGKATTKELVATLEHPNGWHRDTASRLLYERQDAPATSSLIALLTNGKSAYGRLHALHSLEGQRALTVDLVLLALKDSDPVVREHAVKLGERFLHPLASNALRDSLLALVNDPSLNVRYQLAFTIGELNEADRTPALLALAKRDAADKWFRGALFSSMPGQLTEAFSLAAKDAEFTRSPAGQEFLRELLALAGASKDPNELSAALNLVGRAEVPAAFHLARALGEGVQKSRIPGAKDQYVLKLMPLFEQARQFAAASNPEAQRIESIRVLEFDVDHRESFKTLEALLKADQGSAIQQAALNAIMAFNTPSGAVTVTKAWSGLPLAVRGVALEQFLKKLDRINALLDAVEQGAIKPHELSAGQLTQLRAQRAAGIKVRVDKLFAQNQMAKRDDVVKAFQPAMTLRGDAAKGRQIYTERCLSCHRAEGQGNALGPDLVTVKTTGKEKLLVNILDPNREVPPQFLAYAIDTKDGESYTGLVVNETPNSVTLRMAFGQEKAVPRSNIKKMESGGQSLMPEGLEAGLTPQDVANLLEFIIMAKN
jgi:putative membrane-bound dehydrogenase-like protein